MKLDRNPLGFTLVELLVVIAMIGILVGMLIPGVQAVRESARQSQCQSRMSNIYLALSEYQVSYGVWPPGTINATSPIVNEPQGNHLGWLVHLLPQIDEPILAAKVDWSVGIYEGDNELVRTAPLAKVRCPSAPDVLAHATNIVGSQHSSESPIAEDNLGVFYLNHAINPEEDLKDGYAATLLLGEKLVTPDDLGWASGTRASMRNVGEAFMTPSQVVKLPPLPNKTYVGPFGSAHRSGSNFSFANGTVRLIDRAIDPVVLKQHADRQDGTL